MDMYYGNDHKSNSILDLASGSRCGFTFVVDVVVVVVAIVGVQSMFLLILNKD